jgi:adenine phosphoribosyltransferase
MDLKSYIRDIPDFPKAGILFRDITPLLRDPAALRHTLDLFAQHYEGKGIQKIVSMEARGFIFGPAIAARLNAGFAPVRKPGKLPYKSRKVTYDLEYGTDTLAIHEDAIAKGERVLLIDDLLATGGTMGASIKLVEDLGGQIAGVGFIIELTALKGREKLGGYDIYSLIQY